MWRDELTVTASHLFRGMSAGHRDVHVLFLYTHALVERWREGLLWAWAVAKVGGERNEWGVEEVRRAWRDVGGQEGEASVEVLGTVRSTVGEEVVRERLWNAGHVLSGKTRYAFGESKEWFGGLSKLNFTLSLVVQRAGMGIHMAIVTSGESGHGLCSRQQDSRSAR